MKTRSLLCVWLTLAVVLAGCWYAYSLAEDQVAVNSQKIAENAQRDYKLQNYNGAMRQAQEYLRTAPAGPQATEMQKLIGLSQVGLQQWNDGYQTLTDLVKAKPATGKEAPVLEAIALAAMQTRKQHAASEWTDKAVAQYAAAGNSQKQIELLFKYAVWLTQTTFWEFEPGQRIDNYTHRVLYTVANVLKVYDRILEIDGVGGQDTIRALAGKSEVLRTYWHQLQQLPREQWPPQVDSKYPLDTPLPLAIEFEREIVRRFPNTADAPAALLRIGNTYEQFVRDYLAALKAYNELVEKYARSKPAKEAKEFIQQIKAPQLAVSVEGTVLPGDNPKYRWFARNLKKIEFTAYPVELFDVLRKIENLQDLESYPVKSLQAAATWTVETGDKSDHHPMNSEDVVKAPLSEANAYLVTVSGANAEGQKIQVATLMLVSKLATILKSSSSAELIFAGDAVTGEPVPESRVLVQRYEGTKEVGGEQKAVFSYSEHEVPDNGLLKLEGKADQQREQMLAIARQGKNYALVNDYGHFRYWQAQIESVRVYAYTDRPVYRPEQTVNFKHIVRQYKDGVYHTLAGREVSVVINDARGNKVYEQKLVSNDFGSISGSFTLGEKPVLGMYHTQVQIDDQTVEIGPGGQFRVEEYKKPEYTVSVEPEKPTYKVGQKVRAKVHGEYYFGGPVADAQVSYTIHRNTYYHNPIRPLPYAWFYDQQASRGYVGRGSYIWPPRPYRRDFISQGTVKTDANGDAWIEFEAEAFRESPDDDLQFSIDVAMVDQSRREIKESTAIKVTHQAFYIAVDPQKNLYHPQDKVRIELRADNPNNKPVAFEGTAKIYFVTQREKKDDHGKVVQEEKLEELRTEAVKADETGKTALTFVPEKEGMYKITVAAPDPYGGQVEGTSYLWTAQGNGEFAHLAYRDLELVIDKTTLAAGENLQLLVTSQHPNAYVLLTAEADELYYHKLLFVPENGTSIELPVEKSWQPNVTLHASLLHDHKMMSEQIELHVPPVEDFLTVTIRAPKNEFQPREQAEIEVQVADHKGNPVACELSLGAVDSSIFYIQQETRDDIRKFYHGHIRPQLVRTETSYSFRSEGNDRTRMYRRGAGLAGGYGATELYASAPAPASAMADEAAPEAAKQATPKFAETEVRSEFPDTVYWAAHLTTSTEGKATATVRFPDTLTTWRLTSIATDAKTRVGEVKHEVITRKNIIVRLQAPRFFVERDRVLLSAIAHNYLDEEKTVRVKMQVGPQLSLLAASVDGSLVGDEQGSEERHLDVTVPAGGEKRVDFLASALHPGAVQITASALTDTESDAMRNEFEVLEYGAEKLLAESGVQFGAGGSTDDVTVTLDIPSEIRVGSQSLSVRVSPTIAGVMLQSLPYLLEYPYGCTEQTMSRFLPAVLTSHTLRNLGVDLADLKKLPQPDADVERRLQHFRSQPVYDQELMNKIIAVGVERLADFQQKDGGWGWWKQDLSNPYITAYVVSGLALAERSGVQLPEKMLQRGVEFLAEKVVQTEPITRYPWQVAENVSVRTYMLFAIAEADRKLLAESKIREKLDDMYRRRDELNDYSRALLALTLAAAEKTEEAEIVLGNIRDRADVDEQTESVSWGTYSNYFYWYDCGTEATSFSLRALLAIAPDDPMTPKVVNWLMRHRQGTRWFNTKDTANVCYALAEYLKATDELNPDMTVAVEVDGQETKEFRFTRENILSMDQELTFAAEVLGTGVKKVTLRRKGKGNLYWGAYASFFTKEDQITAAGNEIHVHRKYERLEPKVVEKTRRVYKPETRDYVEETYQAIEYTPHELKEGDPLASGDLVQVTLQLDARNNFEYMVFEDPKPAGCEAVDLQSGSRWGDGVGAHMELRDEMVSFFATYLNKGKHNISYRLRAEIPGVFHALPARAESMYAPLVKGNADSRIIQVVEAEQP